MLERLRKFSPTVLRNCAKLRVIHYVDSFNFPEFPADDSADASSGQALAKWLYTPRGDGLPKVLECFYSWTGVQGVKEQFVTSTVPVNFIICLLHGTYCSSREPFELRNNLTGEQLLLRRIHEEKWLLVRCPTERDDAKWTEWEKEAVEWDWRRLEERVFIHCINGSDIIQK
uniref:SH3 domain-containing protein n=1 Tax=Globodera pallida TaxID=36090 RepID=A0A183BLR4_GLOPA